MEVEEDWKLPGMEVGGSDEVEAAGGAAERVETESSTTLYPSSTDITEAGAATEGAAVL